MSEKLITVIATVYNKAPYLKTWAQSVASQTYLDKARIIVIDDGSTDDSVALIKKYADEYKIPIDFFAHEKNQGLLRTILDAYHMLDTKYFTVLDTDDFWISPQKLEKAVKFLDVHEDYSLYFSNYVQRSPSTQEDKLAFPADEPSSTFSSMNEVHSAIHTSSAVFRNFFTPELLDEMERASSGRRVHACETDPFRNTLAFHFGKAYFENSVDAVHLEDIGTFGCVSEIEKFLENMQMHRQIFDFYVKQFGMDNNAFLYLQISLWGYTNAIRIFSDMLNRHTLLDFQGKKYFRDRFFDYGDSDAEKIFNALLEHLKFFKRIGLRVDGNNVIINFEAGLT